MRFITCFSCGNNFGLKKIKGHLSNYKCPNCGSKALGIDKIGEKVIFT